MCKSTPLPPRPTTEVADKIENATSVDNSWSFVNLHLPSTITTAVALLFMMITVWVLFKVYSKYRGPHPQTTSGQTAPSTLPTPSTSTLAPTSTPMMLDVEKLLNVVAHRPVSTMPTPIQAKGPQPPTALFLN